MSKIPVLIAALALPAGLAQSVPSTTYGNGTASDAIDNAATANRAAPDDAANTSEPAPKVFGRDTTRRIGRRLGGGGS